jgi:signal transduction histidine kinase
MPPDVLALGDLDAADPLAVAFAVRRGADLLRNAAWDPDDLRAFVDRLVALAKDESPRVRQSVAEAAPYLPEAVSRDLLAPLAKDPSPFVRDAAERAERKRSALRRTAAKEEEHDSRVARWYREITAPGARAIARRIASHETEYFVRRMVHEAGAAFPPFDEAAGKLRAGLEAPEIDRARMRAELDRMEERVAFLKHVLATGRANAKAEEPELREEKLGAIVLDEVALLAARFPEKAECLAVDTLGVDASLVVDVDAAFLRQALGNILKNAVEAYDGSAGPMGIRIRVGVRALAGGTEAEIVVADKGCGMDDLSRERAFVPFGSVKNGGTGFGLFLARRIARAIHGGDLSLASTRGEGTTVTMTLPLRHDVKKKRGKARRAATDRA